MRRKHSWFIALVVAVLLVTACGPEMATPTPRDEAPAGDTETPTTAPVAEEPTKAEEKTPTKEPTEEPESPGGTPAESDDWHILGSLEAPVTIIEYSDFQ